MTPPQHWLEGLLDILQEAVEGGKPGQGTAFLDGTGADGSGNHGLLATLDLLNAEAASRDISGTSVAGQARHAALHLEVYVRWESGERGPFDWKGSFLPEQVSEAEWQAVRERVRTAYKNLVQFARAKQKDQTPDGDLTGALAGAAAHVAYHLGAIRQMLKVIQA